MSRVVKRPARQGTKVGPPDRDAPLPQFSAMPDSAELCRKFSLGYVCSHKWEQLDIAGIKLTPRDLGPPGPMPYNPAGESAGHKVRFKLRVL